MGGERRDRGEHRAARLERSDRGGDFGGSGGEGGPGAVDVVRIVLRLLEQRNLYTFGHRRRVGAIDLRRCEVAKSSFDAWHGGAAT